MPAEQRAGLLRRTGRRPRLRRNHRQARAPETPMTKLPRRFFQPLAAGAPAPYRELPVRLERMIHFVPPHNEKVRAKIPELIPQVDVVLGNLEDAIPADAKVAARRGFIALAKANDVRRHRAVDAHQRAEQPLGARRPRRDRRRGRRQARRRDAAEGRGAVGHPLHRPAARPARGPARGREADPGPCHPGDRRGREERRRHRRRLAAHARHEPRARRTSRPRAA